MKRSYTLIFLYTLLLNTHIIKAEDNIHIPQDSIKMSYTADEIVIQAFKKNDNISVQPVSATLITDQTIRDRNISNIKEVSAYVPNLFIPDYGSKMTSPAYIRGIGSRINAPSVGLYIDGIPYFDRSTFDFNLNDIDRIEVLRGPQGTLYGRNTMGGIINVYTKSPFKYKETNLSLSAASYDNYKAEASHYGNINNIFGYSASGNISHSGGYFRNQFTGKRSDPVDAAAGRIRLSWHVNPQLYIHLTSAYEYSDQGGYPYGIYNPEDNTVQKVNYNEPSFYRRNVSTSGLNVAYTTNRIQLSSQSSFQYFDGRQGIDQDFSPDDLYFVDFGQRQRMVSQEFNLKSTGSSKYQWQWGAFGFVQDFSTDNDIDYRSTQTHTLQDISTPTRGVALYHQSTINDLFTEGLSLILGARYDWEQTRMHTVVNSLKPDNSITETMNIRKKDHFSQFTPKASLQYRFTNDEIVYFSVSKGYKSGGFNTTVEDEKDRAFKPEQSWNYEIGTKASCLDNLIYTEISLFYIDWKNQQISQSQPSGKGFLLRNAGKSVSKGVEATVHINPLENLSIQLSYGYTHAKFKRYTVNEELSYADNYLPMVPSNTFSTTANYSIRLRNTFLDKIVLNGQYVGLGKLYWNEDNLASQPYYGVFNGKISFVAKNISIDLWAKNIGCKDYITYYFTSMGKTFAQAGRPFTFGTNINVKF
ncbi:TonB-dependent receptor [Dysgonomonas macrotermitis]|uniref:Outer membrane receptor proteins, mostly Fe transport n=1 Tax=Dysgonomonas macrotermitis TaxID=1346286 RepID=A0A1M5F226_9BACT|nr:TonB-dependent receptor [Dysgonomonas macrotermitis]SHF85574.1 Outer membrane receptor proteins, mostly Fe transport [Dysgonomonas macrotermitis]